MYNGAISLVEEMSVNRNSACGSSQVITSGTHSAIHQMAIQSKIPVIIERFFCRLIEMIKVKEPTNRDIRFIDVISSNFSDQVDVGISPNF